MGSLLLGASSLALLLEAGDVRLSTRNTVQVASLYRGAVGPHPKAATSPGTDLTPTDGHREQQTTDHKRPVPAPHQDGGPVDAVAVVRMVRDHCCIPSKEPKPGR
jgi:hypothetical protein